MESSEAQMTIVGIEYAWSLATPIVLDCGVWHRALYTNGDLFVTPIVLDFGA